MKRTIRPLLAVATLACTPALADPVREPIAAKQPRRLPTGAPACGNVLAKGGGGLALELCMDGIDPAALTRTTIMMNKLLVAVGIARPLTFAFATSEPRRMRNGAPACGNVVSRAGTRRVCDQANPE